MSHQHHDRAVNDDEGPYSGEPEALGLAAAAARPATHLVVVMGVSGCGKTTVGQLIAERLDSEFVDGDAFHPQTNIAKMRAGTPLDDADREPWLHSIGAELSQRADTSSSLVIGCSALKRSYRDLIRAEAPGTVFIHLHGTRQLLQQRLRSRPGHFMPATLLDSQLATLQMLEPDEAGRLFDITPTTAGLVEAAHHWLITRR